MRVTVHVNKFHDWRPVPEGVAITEKHKKQRLVKPDADGKMLMRVPVEKDTYVEVIGPSEAQLIEQIIVGRIRQHINMGRSQALATYLSTMVLGDHAESKWMTHFEVHDDGPSEELFRAKLEPHVACGNIREDAVEDLVEAYLHPADVDQHIHHLHLHFSVPKRAKPALAPEGAAT